MVVEVLLWVLWGIRKTESTATLRDLPGRCKGATQVSSLAHPERNAVRIAMQWLDNFPNWWITPEHAYC